MGDRFIITVVCPGCGAINEDVYYAPTCGFMDHRCQECGIIIDLEQYTGISAADASNVEEIESIVVPFDERLQQFNDLFAEDYASWDDVPRADLLYYLRVLLIEKEIPRHVVPYGDDLLGCLLLAWSWVRERIGRWTGR